ncbi:hypothetical protein QJ48_23250 [Paenibacillus sp. A3]|uniref:hypothetical protein n=1 Tax=Paenibacillus sp. A3 TaxID=1337054 RepID=UPI0006D58456|nr:hypothetical protein [Paenibacillus sp. A3]KPV57250.1 hypothetical protein QJ48_23250 [Paenibacillus sp. A3]
MKKQGILIDGVEALSKKAALSMLLMFVMLAAWQPYTWSRVYAQEVQSSPREDVVLVTAPEAKDNEPYVRMLRALGQSVTMTDPGSLGRMDWTKVKLLVLPGRAAGALDGSAADRIAAEVSKGMPIYTEQRTPLSEKLGLSFDGTQAEVSRLSDTGRNTNGVPKRRPSRRSARATCCGCN